MDLNRFVQRMVELMPQLIRGFNRHESNCLSRGEITVPQLWVLEALSRREGALMSELAKSLGISRPAATGLIDRLIAQGLVERRSPADDRRTVIVRITAKGKKIVDNIWAQKQKTLVKVFSQISGKDRQQYLQILEQVVQIVNQSGKGPDQS